MLISVSTDSVRSNVGNSLKSGQGKQRSRAGVKGCQSLPEATMVWVCGSARARGLESATALSLGGSAAAVTVLSPLELTLRTISPTLVLQKLLEVAQQVDTDR